MTIAEQFKAARRCRGLTQTHLAELLGINQSMIGQIESGHRKISLDRIAAYADRLGWNRSELSRDLADLTPSPPKRGRG